MAWFGSKKTQDSADQLMADRKAGLAQLTPEQVTELATSLQLPTDQLVAITDQAQLDQLDAYLDAHLTDPAQAEADAAAAKAKADQDAADAKAKAEADKKAQAEADAQVSQPDVPGLSIHDQLKNLNILGEGLRERLTKSHLTSDQRQVIQTRLAQADKKKDELIARGAVDLAAAQRDVDQKAAGQAKAAQ